MFHAPTRHFAGYEKFDKTRQKKIFSVLLICVLIFSLSACGKGKSAEDDADPNAPDRDNTPVVLTTEAPGNDVFSSGGAKVDYSNASKGYIMAQYTGSNPKVKLQLDIEGKTYSYDLSTGGDWEAFPLSMGSGKYTAGIYENISGEEYSQAFKESFDAKLDEEFGPFLHPNQFVDFTEKTKVVPISEDVCTGVKTDLGAVEKMYEYVVNNIDYDYDKAATVQPGYLPDIDETLDTGKGICFDYASVLTAMLRVQGIPCKLVIGYAGSAYHSWISVYTDETGWVDNMIEFHGDWTQMDPTFAASGNDSDPNIVGNGEDYQPQYYY